MGTEKGIIMRNIVKIRAVVSSLLLILAVLVIFTGIGLYLAPSGRTARETGWTFLGFNLIKLEKLHTVTGFIMAAIIVVHFIINFTVYKNEMKQLFKRK